MMVFVAGTECGKKVVWTDPILQAIVSTLAFTLKLEPFEEFGVEE